MSAANDGYVPAPEERDDTQKSELCEKIVAKIRDTGQASFEDQYTLLSACHWDDNRIDELLGILLDAGVAPGGILSEIARTDFGRGKQRAALVLVGASA